MVDDRLPVLLVILDGLGDRGCPELGGRTPCEAATTPHLDALARRGASGVLVPFGPGRSTSSEVSHWSLFGFEGIPFPGRAALEALGVGLLPPVDVPLFQVALRAGTEQGGVLRLGARARPREDVAAAAELFAALGGRTLDGISFELLPLRTGEAVLVARGAGSHQVSDSDALFEHLHPWMRPRAWDDAENPREAARVAGVLERWLRDSRALLRRHPRNAERAAAGLPALDVLVSKWPSRIDPRLPSFEARTGLRGAAVSDTALYRGFARLLGLRLVDLPYDPTRPTEDMRQRIAAAADLLADHDFVHVHVKSTDEAAHTKRPSFKREIIEAVDAGLDGLGALAERAIVAVTGDHASPSTGAVLHSGDPTPFVVAGPGVRPDGVSAFGEWTALAGHCGRLRSSDVLPLLAGFANRPFFLGHRPGPARTCALPAAPEPMPIDLVPQELP
jgi:2,3-bisphosphoglycerate-independent phosphoglycerate mutase